MNVIKDLESIEFTYSRAITIGSFDGVHIGHQEILKKCKDIAKSYNLRSTVITFEPHPRLVLSKDAELKLLTSFEEKKSYFENLGIDELIVINFTLEFAKLNAEEFIKDLVHNKIGFNWLIIGYDHRFGKERSGDESLLRELGLKYGFHIEKVGPSTVGEDIVSSTKIRKLLLKGDVVRANKMLGRYYSIESSVVRGAGRGKILGFPTANLEPINELKLIPAKGVYAIEAKLNETVFQGVLNIGERPTFGDALEPLLEAHIFDFNENIYGKNVSIYFVERLRDEKKFGDVEELRNQIREDIEKAKKILINKSTSEISGVAL